MSDAENKPMEIGDDWFCDGADFDSDKPHIILARQYSSEEVEVPVPKQLAHYLKTHWCGSQIMHDSIANKAKQSVRQDIKDILF